jgi:enamine deaminase RidA (YjgF/YER057c/UK114 family)
MQRKNISSGTCWESIVRYSRAVRGDFDSYQEQLLLTKRGDIIGLDNPYLQTIQIIKNIQSALQMTGACLKDVIRTRIYITDINNWEKV